MKKKDVEKLERCIAQVDSFGKEVGALSKKSPHDGINAFKLKFINKVLGEVNAVLGKKFMPFADFDLFDEDAPPSNSDALMILSQYAEALELLRSENIYMVYSGWYYKIDNIDDEDEDEMDKKGIRTRPPASLTRKG